MIVNMIYSNIDSNMETIMDENNTLIYKIKCQHDHIENLQNNIEADQFISAELKNEVSIIYFNLYTLIISTKLLLQLN